MEGDLVAAGEFVRRAERAAEWCCDFVRGQPDGVTHLAAVRRRCEFVVASHVSVELWDCEVAAAVAGGVDEAFVDEAGARGAELFGAAAHDGRDVTGAVFAGAQFGHGAQVPHK